MDISGIIHCLFEQSGTFRDEFRALGFTAYDYDIQNEYKKTDHQLDLFAQIELAYRNEPSIFDTMAANDLLLAFFPCTYFNQDNALLFSFSARQYRSCNDTEAIRRIIKRADLRRDFYTKLLKLCFICIDRGLRLIIENPYHPTCGYLSNNFLIQPTVIDHNRHKRGDYYRKPTAYYFFNCKPTIRQSYERPAEVRCVEHMNRSRTGFCGKERSELSPAYARNFICDFILGKEQPHTLLELF